MPPATTIPTAIETATPTTTAAISGLIMTDGPGLDRGLQSWRGAPLALHVMMRLSPQVADIMINTNRNIGPYEGFGVAVWPDEMQGLSGALAGIQTGLQHCDTRFMVSVPCDAPELPHDLVQRLSSALLMQGADLAMAVSGEGAERQVHPDFCLMESSLLENLTHFLRSGGRERAAWHASLQVAEVPFASSAPFKTAP
jgi:molybdopterin-guanine dinucleotide biosynthesis protein A